MMTKVRAQICMPGVGLFEAMDNGTLYVALCGEGCLSTAELKLERYTFLEEQVMLQEILSAH